jgi:hypothetical protein
VLTVVREQAIKDIRAEMFLLLFWAVVSVLVVAVVVQARLVKMPKAVFNLVMAEMA